MQTRRTIAFLLAPLLAIACAPRGYDGDCVRLDAVGIPYDVGPDDDAHYRATSSVQLRVNAAASPPNDAGPPLGSVDAYFRSRDSRPVAEGRSFGPCREYFAARYGPPRVNAGDLRVEAVGSPSFEVPFEPANGFYSTRHDRSGRSPLDPWVRPGTQMRVSSRGSADFPAFEFCGVVPQPLVFSYPSVDSFFTRRMGEALVIAWNADSSDDEVAVDIHSLPPPTAPPESYVVFECRFPQRLGRAEISAELMREFDRISSSVRLFVVRQHTITRVFDDAPVEFSMITDSGDQIMLVSQ